MTEVERYLFDLQGYLIVEDVLDAGSGCRVESAD